MRHVGVVGFSVETDDDVEGTGGVVDEDVKTVGNSSSIYLGCTRVNSDYPSISVVIPIARSPLDALK